MYTYVAKNSESLYTNDPEESSEKMENKSEWIV